MVGDSRGDDTQGDAARLSPFRSALGWYVSAFQAKDLHRPHPDDDPGAVEMSKAPLALPADAGFQIGQQSADQLPWHSPRRGATNGRFSNMSQSLVKNLLHLVYSTKHRTPWLPAEVRPRLYAYQAGIFKDLGSPALVIGGMEDHVHALFSLSKNHALIKIVEEVKKGSSKWMKTDGTGNQEFYWQGGYAAFSVSQSSVEEVSRYIENQEEHHRKMTFQDELRILFQRHGIEFDERYVWE